MMKTNGLVEKIVVTVAGVAVALVCGELLLAALRVAPPVPIDAQMRYNYLDVHTPFFKEYRGSDGRRWCRTVRPHASSVAFPVEKDKGVRRVFLIGESTAQGFDLSLLDRALKEALPGSGFELINCGMGSYDAWRTGLVAREVVRYHPDLVITIVGNSEFWATRRLNRFRYQGLFSRFRLTRLLAGALFPNVEVKNAAEADRYYERNITGIVRLMKARGIPLVLCTLPVNYRDAYFVPKDVLFDREYVLAEMARERGDYPAAAPLLRSLEARFPEDPFVLHLRGTVAEEQGDPARARTLYRAALDHARQPFTCTPARNERIRAIARRSGVICADVARRVEEVASRGIPGFDLFYDNSHPRMPLYAVYAETIVDAVRSHDLEGGAAVLAAREEWLPDRRTFTGRERLLKMLQERPDDVMFILQTSLGAVFNGQGGYYPSAAYSLDRLLSDDPSLFDALLTDRRRIAALIGDQLWFSQGFNADADRYWASVLVNAGEALRCRGERQRALRYYEAAAALRPKAFEPWFFIGKALLQGGDRAGAKAAFAKAAGLNPALAWLNDLPFSGKS